jgi:hypothetical protein
MGAGTAVVRVDWLAFASMWEVSTKVLLLLLLLLLNWLLLELFHGFSGHVYICSHTKYEVRVPVKTDTPLVTADSVLEVYIDKKYDCCTSDRTPRRITFDFLIIRSLHTLSVFSTNLPTSLTTEVRIFSQQLPSTHNSVGPSLLSNYKHVRNTYLFIYYFSS